VSPGGARRRRGVAGALIAVAAVAVAAPRLGGARVGDVSDRLHDAPHLLGDAASSSGAAR
jgi:hypothetical protein